MDGRLVCVSIGLNNGHFASFDLSFGLGLHHRPSFSLVDTIISDSRPHYGSSSLGTNDGLQSETRNRPVFVLWSLSFFLSFFLLVFSSFIFVF